ncbi:MAG: SpoIIIAH-like family protein, partial [Angelakisella sp.]
MKMRMNMILSKKHIILSALVIALSIAIYLNWEYVRNNSGDFINTAGLAASVAANGTEAEAAAYGEAYFAEAKLSRTKSRDEAVDALKYMLEDAHLSTVQMKELTAQATKLALSIEREGKIENLIKAKGFADCMVYLDAEKIDVLVKCSNL